MKKIMIAVAAVIGSGIGFAHATEMTIDFDGRTTCAASFMEVIKIAREKGVGSDLAAVPAPTAINTDIVDPIAEEKEINKSIGTAIKDCERKRFVALKAKFKKLLAEGTLQEKRDFVYNTKRSYDFPKRLFTGMEKTFVASNDMDELGKMDKTCVAWEPQEVCTTGQKEVCHTVCAAAQLVCMVVAGVTAPVCAWGAPVCHLACHFVDETTCTTVHVCAHEL